MVIDEYSENDPEIEQMNVYETKIDYEHVNADFVMQQKVEISQIIEEEMEELFDKVAPIENKIQFNSAKQNRPMTTRPADQRFKSQATLKDIATVKLLTNHSERPKTGWETKARTINPAFMLKRPLSKGKEHQPVSHIMNAVKVKPINKNEANIFDTCPEKEDKAVSPRENQVEEEKQNGLIGSIYRPKTSLGMAKKMREKIPEVKAKVNYLYFNQYIDMHFGGISGLNKGNKSLKKGGFGKTRKETIFTNEIVKSTQNVDQRDTDMNFDFVNQVEQLGGLSDLVSVKNLRFVEKF